MCNFLSGLVLRNGDVLTHPMLDSHSELVQHFKLPDAHQHHQHFAKVELTPEGDWLDVSIWKFRLDEQTVPGWWADVAEQAEATLRARADKMILKTGEHSLLIDGCWIIGGDAVIRDVRAARIPRVSGGSITDVRGGSITNVWGGSITNVRGGSITNVRGGTITNVRGGTITNVWGGSITDVWGGTITNVRGGSITDVWGGSITDVWGGSITNVRGGSITDVSGGSITNVRGGSITDVWGGSITNVRGGSITRVSGGSITDVRGEPYTPLLDDSAKAHVATKDADKPKSKTKAGAK